MHKQIPALWVLFLLWAGSFSLAAESPELASGDSVKVDTVATLPEFSEPVSISIGGLDPQLDSLVIPWLGTKHRTGRQSKAGIDCSGFVQVILQDYLNHTTVRSSAGNYKVGTPVDKEQLLPGDVVFFKKRGRIYHSGVWIGNGRFAHASTHQGVIVTELDNDAYWSSHYTGARRYVENPRFPSVSTKDSVP
jgi:lipoprotein Spr